MNANVNRVFSVIITFFSLLIVTLNFLPSYIMKFYISYSFFIDCFFLSMFFFSILSEVLTDILEKTDGQGNFSLEYVMAILLGVMTSYSLYNGYMGKYKSLYEIGFILFFIFLIPLCILLFKGIRSRFIDDQSKMGGLLAALLGFFPFYIILRVFNSKGLFSNFSNKSLNWINIFIWFYGLFFLIIVLVTVFNKVFGDRFSDFAPFKNSIILKKVKHVGGRAEKKIKKKAKLAHKYLKEKNKERKKLKLEEKSFMKQFKFRLNYIEKNNPELFKKIERLGDQVLFLEKEKKKGEYVKEPLKKLSLGIKELHTLYLMIKISQVFRNFFSLIEDELDDYLIEVCDVLDEEVEDIEEVVNSVYKIEDIEFVLKNFFYNIHNLNHYNNEISAFLRDKNAQDWLKLIEKDEYKRMGKKYSEFYNNYIKLLSGLSKLSNLNEIESRKKDRAFFDKYSKYITKMSNFQFSILYVTKESKSLRYVLEYVLKEVRNRIYDYSYMSKYLEREFKGFNKIKKRLS